MKNIFKVVFVIIGTMIGAGFASGQEIYLFFFSYGIKGLIGLFISGVILGVVMNETLKIVDKYGVNTYKEFLEIIIRKNGKIQPIINTIINTFILITFFIMIAGFGAYFEQELGINRLIGSILLSVATFIIFMTSVKGVVKVNELLVPVLIVFLIIIGIINLKDIPVFELNNYIAQTKESNFIISAILYSSYNSILLIPVLLTLKDYIQNKKQILKIASISTAIIILLSIIVFLLLVKIDVDITQLEMPVVYVVSHSLKLLKYAYRSYHTRIYFYNSYLFRNQFFAKYKQKQKKLYTNCDNYVYNLGISI